MDKFKEIGKRLRILRGPMSQEDFAKKLGTSFRAYQYYEKGERIPKGDLLHRIASVTGMPVDWILSGEQRREKTDEEIKEDIRHDLWMEKQSYTELDVEQLVPAYREALKEQSMRVADARALYGTDLIIDKIVKLLAGMSEEEKRAILKYIETQKKLIDELKLKKSEPEHFHQKKPRPVPIDFSAVERYALRLYEFAEQKGLAHKLDELLERLLSGLEEQQDRLKKEADEHKG